MKRPFLGLIAALALTVPALAQPEVTPYTLEAMGCMRLMECTEDVEEVTSIKDIEDYYQDDRADFSGIASEADSILTSLGKAGVKVYMADARYFPTNTRGLYYADANLMFLNAGRLVKPHHMINLLRHEGWHAAQDCMAGTIENTHLAVIHLPADVPGFWTEMATRLYPANMVPWEAEAKWMGSTEGETAKALQACSSETPMWEIYEPTPLTGEWLRSQGWMK